MNAEVSTTAELAVIIEHMERMRGVTLQSLDMVPEGWLGWRPSEKVRSIAEEFDHIARTEAYYTLGLLDGVWQADLMKGDEVPLSHFALRAGLEETRATLMARLRGLDPDRLGQIADTPVSPVPWPLRSWLWYLIEHEVHHKAVIATRLREIGLVPPFFAFVLPDGMRPDIG